MKRAAFYSALLLAAIWAVGCVGLVQIGKGPLVVGQPRPTPTPEVSK